MQTHKPIITIFAYASYNVDTGSQTPGHRLVSVRGLLGTRLHRQWVSE